MKRIGIIFNPMIQAAAALAPEVSAYLTARGLEVWSSSTWEPAEARAQVPGTDLMLSIGGDGTILRAVQAVVGEDTPICGINLGRLGFMTELSKDEIQTRLPEILDGSGWIDTRTMLQATVGEPGAAPVVYHALNDVVAGRGEVARMVNVAARVDGELLNIYKADGVIVATATGSTGYAFAAGGPVIHPQSGDYLLVPMLPHLCSGHALVIPGASQLTLEVQTAYRAVLSVDGNQGHVLADGAVVTISVSPYTTRFVRLSPPASFYGTLEQRLKGKQ
jgi:NAD+ kinase